MKKLLMATGAFMMISAGAALAQQAPVKVPTGIDVPGRTYYVIPTGSIRVVQLDESCTPRAIATRSCVNAAPGGERPDTADGKK